MLAEHLVYSAAIAVIAGMLFFRYTGRDCSWIIILVAYAPDIDTVADPLLQGMGFSVRFMGHPIHHGSFHTLAALLIFTVVFAFVVHPFGIRFSDALLFSAIGFGAHLFEDALVYPAHAMYFWPLLAEKTGLGWLSVTTSEEAYNADFFHIANSNVLIVGIVFLLIAILVRTRFEGPAWIRWYMPERLYRRLSGKGDLP